MATQSQDPRPQEPAKKASEAEVAEHRTSTPGVWIEAKHILPPSKLASMSTEFREKLAALDALPQTDITFYRQNGEAYCAFLIVEIAGRTFVRSDPDGHMNAYSKLKRELFAAGFTHSDLRETFPMIGRGGAVACLRGEKNIELIAASGAFIECDKEIAAQIIADLFPEYTVTAKWQFEDAPDVVIPAKENH